MVGIGFRSPASSAVSRVTALQVQGVMLVMLCTTNLSSQYLTRPVAVPHADGGSTTPIVRHMIHRCAEPASKGEMVAPSSGATRGSICISQDPGHPGGVVAPTKMPAWKLTYVNALHPTP